MMALMLHGDGASNLDAIYFWTSVLIAGLPIGVFVTIAVLAIRGYRRRRVADGGGEPPPADDHSSRPLGWKAIPR